LGIYFGEIKEFDEFLKCELFLALIFVVGHCLYRCALFWRSSYSFWSF